MTNAEPNERLERLLMARRKIEEQLVDPTTPAYSIAPLTNQLRLTDKEIDRIQRAEETKDDGLPITPEDATFLDFLRYHRDQRRDVSRPARAAGRRRGHNEWATRYDAILASWSAAGFVAPTPPWRGRPWSLERSRQDDAAERSAWVDTCRAELARCLDRAAQPERTRP